MRTFRPPFGGDLTPDARVVVEMSAPAYAADLVAVVHDADATAVMRAHLERWVHPDFDVELPLAAPAGERGGGAGALVAAWSELLSVFSSYRPRIVELVDAGDGRVALFGEDTIQTQDGIDLTIPVGAIYEVEDGVVRRAAFLPDQAAARERLSASRGR